MPSVVNNLLPLTVPDDLRSLPAWLVWRFIQREGEPRPRKVPFYADGAIRRGVQGLPKDRERLVTFDEAVVAAQSKGFDGVGMAPLDGFGITALDFDDCMVEGGVHPEVERLVAGTYSETSPSGEGVRAFFKGHLGNEKSGGAPFGFEAFSTKGFVTVTGNALDICEMLGAENAVVDLTDDVRALYAERFGEKGEATNDPLMAYEPRLGLSEAQMLEILDVLDPGMARADWLAVGMALHHETEGEGFYLWHDWSVGSREKYPGEEELRKQWESLGTPDGRPVTARTLLKMGKENGAYINTDLASAAEFDALADSAALPDNLRFKVVPAGEFSRGQRPGWIMKGVLPKAELVVLFGESGSGKSFVALDMAVAIASGADWRGHRTKQGRVVYIAAEGGGGFRNRLTAYERHHGLDLDSIPFGIIHAAPNFLLKADAVDIAKAVVAVGKADVIMVDTFAQVMPGANENAGEDVGKALAHCKGIHRATGALVVLIHHAGKDSSKGARGWSGLRAAADAEIEVQRTVGGRLIRVSKQKDGDDSGEWGFDLDVVAIGEDEDGDIIDSCVVVEAPVPTMGKVGGGKRPVGKWERLVIDVMGEIALGQNSGIEVDAVLKEVIARSPPHDGMGRDTRKQHARRALMALCEGDEAPYFHDKETNCLEVL